MKTKSVKYENVYPRLLPASHDRLAHRHRNRRLRPRHLYQECHPGLQTRRDLRLHHAGRRLQVCTCIGMPPCMPCGTCTDIVCTAG